MPYRDPDYMHKYRLSHKEEIAQQRREYSHTHREHRAHVTGQWRQEHKHDVAQYNVQYSQTHKDEITQQRVRRYVETRTDKLAAAKAYCEKTWSAWLGAKLKSCAGHDRKSGQEYNLDKTFILSLLHRQNYRCAVTGVPLTRTFGDPAAASIDRMDSSKGHTTDNVQIVCNFYNIGKGNRSELQARALIQRIRDAALNDDVFRGATTQSYPLMEVV